MINDSEPSQMDFHKIFFDSEADRFSFMGVFVSGVDFGSHEGVVALTPSGRVVILVYSDQKWEKHMGYTVYESIEDLLKEHPMPENTTSKILREATVRNISLCGPCQQICCLKPRVMAF